MRPDEQRAALDRFVDVGDAVDAVPGAARRVAGGAPRPGRPQAAGARAGAGGGPAQFGLNEIDAVAPQPGEDDALVDDIRRLSELDALREAAQTARAALSGRRWTTPRRGAASAVDGVGQAKAALEATDDAALRALAARLGGGAGRDRRRVDRARRLSRRIAQRCKHFGDQAGPPGRAAHTDAQVRRRHRRRAGVGAASRAIGWRSSTCPRRRSPAWSAGSTSCRPKSSLPRRELTKARTKAAKGLVQGGDRRAVGIWRWPTPSSRSSVAPLAARADDSAPDHAAVRVRPCTRPRRCRRGRVRLPGAPRHRRAAAEQERIGRRAVARHARARGGAGRVRRGHHDGFRRGRRRSRRAGGVQIGGGWPGWPAPIRSSSSHTCLRSPPTPTSTSSSTAAGRGKASGVRRLWTTTTAWPSWRACWRGWVNRTAGARRDPRAHSKSAARLGRDLSRVS